jgi:hypothetical protein
LHPQRIDDAAAHQQQHLQLPRACCLIRGPSIDRHHVCGKLPWLMEPSLNSQTSVGKLVEAIELDSAHGPEGEAELHGVLASSVRELLCARRRVAFDVRQRIGAVIAAVMLGVAIEKRGGHDISPLVAPPLDRGHAAERPSMPKAKRCDCLKWNRLNAVSPTTAAHPAVLNALTRNSAASMTFTAA